MMACSHSMQRKNTGKIVLIVLAFSTLTPPTRGSHYKVSHPEIEEILTIPAHKSIKQVYIKKFVDIMDGITGS